MCVSQPCTHTQISPDLLCVYMCVGAHTHKLQVWHYFKAATA